MDRKNIAKVNGVDTPIDPTNPKVVPMIISGRTMLPVRFVAENLGCKVDWDTRYKTDNNNLSKGLKNLNICPSFKGGAFFMKRKI